MTQCYTQRNMQSNFYGGQAHEYISENYESVQPENKSLMDWLVCHCSPNTYVVYHSYNDSHRHQPNINDVSD